MIVNDILTAVVCGAGGASAAPTYHFSKTWIKKRRKFTCDVCKKRKRVTEGSAPLSLDLDYGTELVPLNLRVCKGCVPSA